MKNMQTEVMNNTHPEWDEFMCKLDERVSKFNCNHDLWNAVYVLMKFYPEVSLGKSLAYFKRKGGYCDCEILMNVYHPVPENIESLLNELKY